MRDKTMKVGASIVTARRNGTTSAFDELNKYFTHEGMPVASGQNWNGVYGWDGINRPELDFAYNDLEGMQQARTLARNMCFLLKAIKLGISQFGLPQRSKL